MGQTILLFHGDEATIIKGIIQPLRYKNKLFLNGTFRNAGLNDESSYLYLGLPSNDLAGNSDAILSVMGKRLVTVKTDMMYFSNTPLYEWAVLKEYHDEEEDDEDD